MKKMAIMFQNYGTKMHFNTMKMPDDTVSLSPCR